VICLLAGYNALIGVDMSELILLTTPIGNMQDLTPRALQVMQQYEFFAVEDTRTFKELYRKLGIEFNGKHILSFHDHSDNQKIAGLLDKVKQGTTLVVASDAGSPAISDPAYPLIQAAIGQDIVIKTSPGVSSVITALELSGLPAIPFHFHGFLPREKGKREKVFKSHGSQYGTHLYFEGVSRVKQSLEQITQLYPEAQFAVARELTKEYESVYRFQGKSYSKIAEQIVEKGEFVLLWHNEHQEQTNDSEVRSMATELLDKGAHPKKLSKLLAKLTGLSPKECYDQLQKTKKS
jgi:16S rRNA (cytidine1402-2'-O)-methyltransferase